MSSAIRQVGEKMPLRNRSIDIRAFASRVSSKLASAEVMPRVPIVFARIRVCRLLGSAVYIEVCRLIAGEIQIT